MWMVIGIVFWGATSLLCFSWLLSFLTEGRGGHVTHSFKAKTESIPLCVPRSSFTRKVTNSEINSITSVYYIEYFKNLLKDQEV
jgi:hypothetical protein